MLAKSAVSQVAIMTLVVSSVTLVMAEEHANPSATSGQQSAGVIQDAQVRPAGHHTAGSYNSQAGSLLSPQPGAPEVWSLDGCPHFIQRFGAAVDIGDGVGFDDGYATLEYMAPLDSEFVWDIFFTDLRFLIHEGDQVGANLGLAYRKYHLERNRIYGANIFYDYTQTEFNEFGQVGLGAESLGPIWDFRTNVYLPLSETHGAVPNGFVGNSLVLRDEFALNGVDFEVGINLWDTARVQARVLAGLYHFDSKTENDATGWRLRGEGALDQQYWIDMSLQDDDLFGTTFSVGLAIRWADRFTPYGIPARATSDHKFFRRPRDVETNSIAHRLSAPIERLQNIVIEQRSVLATDAAGAPLNFIHVDDNAMGGTGTFEDPYDSLGLALADPNAGMSVIYTPFGGNYTEDVTLVMGTSVLSNGPVQVVDTQLGSRVLPNSGTGTLPTLMGDVTMADNTRFSGFDVTGGISANGVMNVTLDNNRVTTTAAMTDAVMLTDVTGAMLDRLTLNSTGMGGSGLNITNSDAIVTNVSASSAMDDGVVIESGADARAVSFTNLSVTNAALEGVDIDVLGAGNLTVSFDGVTSITSLGDALDASLGAMSTGNLDLTLDGASLQSMMGRGVNIEKLAGATGNITNATLSNSKVTAEMDAVVLAGVAGMAMVGAELDSLTLTSNAGHGLRLDDSNATVTDLTVTKAALNGVEINVIGTNDVTVGFAGKNKITASGNALDAELASAMTGDLMLSLNGMTLESTAQAGVDIDGGMGGGGVITITRLSDVTITKAMTGGFLVDRATFDIDTMPMGMMPNPPIMTNLTVGKKSTTTNVKGDGVRLMNAAGELNFDTLDIFNDSGTGLHVENSAGLTLTSGPNSTIKTTNGPALDLMAVDIDLAFDSVQSDDSPMNGVLMDAVSGKLEIAKTTINLSTATAIQIQNTAMPLTALFGATKIHSTIGPLVGDNVVADPMANVGFDSLEIIFP